MWEAVPRAGTPKGVRVCFAFRLRGGGKGIKRGRRRPQEVKTIWREKGRREGRGNGGRVIPVKRGVESREIPIVRKRKGGQGGRGGVVSR